VTINDKHLEVIIKQMTTKVLITYEGDTPLLRREVIDYIIFNILMKLLIFKKKQTACYVPLLLGITSCKNNPILFLRKVFKKQLVYLQKQQLKGESIG
jgi:DNA-directed RNA polymerase subunit beta'